MDCTSWGLVLILVLIVIWIFLWITVTANNLVLYPSHDHYSDIHECKDVYINTNTYDSTECLDGSFVHAKHFTRQSKKVVLFFHGSTGNISHRRYIQNICAQYGFDLLLIDYRGYGQSPGKASLDGILRDGEVSYHWLRRSYDADQIILWGESLGGAVAAYVGHKYPCDRMVLFSTFSSLDDVVVYSHNMENWKVGINFVFDQSINNLPTKYVLGKIHCPILLIHSKEDDYVPYQCCEELAKHLNHTDSKVITIKGKHSQPKLSPTDFAYIINFCHGKQKIKLGCKYELDQVKETIKRFEQQIKKVVYALNPHSKEDYSTTQ